MLIGALKTLRDKGNSVLLVEHDEAALRASEWIVELGPEAGENGGRLVFNGSIEDCLKSDVSRTGMYLSGRAKISRPSARLAPLDKFLSVKGASENNLKNIDASFPVGLFTVVCGVSGSGKSTLVNDILAKAAAAKLNGAKEIGRRAQGHRRTRQFRHLRPRRPVADRKEPAFKPRDIHKAFRPSARALFANGRSQKCADIPRGVSVSMSRADAASTAAGTAQSASTCSFSAKFT